MLSDTETRTHVRARKQTNKSCPASISPADTFVESTADVNGEPLHVYPVNSSFSGEPLRVHLVSIKFNGEPLHVYPVNSRFSGEPRPDLPYRWRFIDSLPKTSDQHLKAKKHFPRSVLALFRLALAQQTFSRSNVL